MSNNKLPLVAPNLVDRAIAIFSPKLAADRIVQRTRFAMLGGYTGAKLDRASLNRWMPTAGSPTTDIIADLPMLRARSRDQMRNAPVALGALNTATSQVIGTGLSFTPSIDAEFLGLSEEDAEAWQNSTKRRFDAWAESPDCDVGRRLSFYGIQELAFRSKLESGDILVTTPRVERAGAAAMLALQLIEADRVCNPDRKPDTDTMIDGVEINTETGEAVAFHVARQHPGDRRRGGIKWDRIEARGANTGRLNAILLFKPLRPGQIRGVPWIAPIIEPLKQLERWTDAELNAAVVSSLFSVFVKMDPDAFQDLFDEDAQKGIVQNAGQWSGEMESGKAINLLPGESVETTTPGRPNPEFDPFWTAIVRQIGMALEVPFEVLVMHFQSSYSAARGALLMAWKTWRARRDFMATYFCQPIYELWLSEEIASGRIQAPGFFANALVRKAWCKGFWTGDGPGSIDPVKEVTAAEKRVALGISTKEAESVLHDGISWEQKHRQRVKEINAEKRDGIYAPPAGSAPVADPSMPDDDE